MIKKKIKKKNNIIDFPSKLSSLEKEIEAIVFAAAEPLDIETIKNKISKKTDVEKVLGKAKAKKDLGRNFGSDLTEREVLWYINQEHAKCVEDLIWRRTKLGLRLSSKQVRELNSYIKKLN